MTLLYPAGLVFAALIPLIVILYLLKLRRQPAQVSTLMFWQRVTGDTRRRALFQRLRQILSLLLHLLIFGLLLLALARPEFRSFQASQTPFSTVVVLDCRARMQTLTGAGGTRFSEARRIAEGYLRRATPRQPVALLAVEGAPRVACGLTGEERTLLDALAALQPTDAGGLITDSVQLAAEMLSASAAGGRVIVVSDEVPPLPATPLAPGKAAPRIEAKLVDRGAARENVGILRLSARPLPNGPETDEVLVEIGNFGNARQTGTVELNFEGRVVDVKPYDLAPGERRTDIYPSLAARSGLANARGWLSAHLTHAGAAGDALALDDDAYAVVPPPQPIRVLLVTRGNWFLESLLKADDAVQFDELAPDAFDVTRAAGFHAVILDDWLPDGFPAAPEQLPPGNFLFVNRAPFAAEAAATLEHPLITDTEAANPVLQLVNLRNVTILRAQSWTLPAAGTWQFTAPVRAFEHPLIITGERAAPGQGQARQRLAALAFGAADSDLPLRIAFPLLVHNTLHWLAARDTSADRPAAVRAGETIDVLAGAKLWLQPQRSYLPIGNIPAAELLTGPATYQPLSNGFYLLRTTGAPDRWLPVNTLDPAMSGLPADGTSRQTSKAATGGDQSWSINARGWWDLIPAWPPWVALALIAFVLCTLEWWGFHRRRTE